MAHAHASKHTSIVSYQDCLSGKVGAPKEKKRKALFQLSAIALSMPCTATVSWIMQSAAHISWATFASSLYLYPLTFGIAILVRFLFANPILDKVTHAFIAPHLKGVKKMLSITVLNILIMGTAIGLIRTAILAGSGDMTTWNNFFTYLPVSYLVSFIFGYFVTSPLLKKAFMKQGPNGIQSRRIVPAKLFSK